jgi:uncharacterized protein (DUF433 family)
MAYCGSMDRITMEPGQRSNARIRGTPITVWEVYRALSLPGTTDSEVLSKYPELEPEDLAAVREFAAKSIESRTHDEFTGRPILPRDRLVNGRYYKGRCQNATIARWNADENCFYHGREKFGRIYIETIKYPTDVVEPLWDVLMSWRNCWIVGSRSRLMQRRLSPGTGMISTSTPKRCGTSRTQRKESTDARKALADRP